MNLSRHTITPIALLSLTLIAFALRAYCLNCQSLWIDEAWTDYFARLSLSELWQLLQTVEIMPPFYHPSTIYWVRVFGDSEYALRFYSLIFGVTTIPLCYRIGRDLGDKRLGFLTALLLTFAPFQIWHSQEARMYSALTATAALSMWGFVNLRLSRHDFRGNLKWGLVYVCGTTWAIMVHYHGVVLIGIQGLFLLLTWRKRWRGYLVWGSMLGFIGLLLTPWLVFGLNLLQSYVNWIPQPTLSESFFRSAKAYTLGEIAHLTWQNQIGLSLFLCAYALGLYYASRRSWRTWSGSDMLAFLVAFTLAPNIAAWLYGEFRTTVYFERYLIFVQIGYLLTVACGLLFIYDKLLSTSSIKIKLFGLAICLVCMLATFGYNLNNYYYNPAYAKENWRGIAQTISAFEQPHDAILLTGDGGEHAFRYYYHGNSPLYYPFNISPHEPSVPRLTGDAALQKLAEIITPAHRLWYTPYGMELDPMLEGWLNSHAYPAWHKWLGTKRLALYGSPALPTPRHVTLNQAVSPELTLQTIALPDTPIAANDLLPLNLTWQIDAPLSQNYQLSWRLTNPSGDLFTQNDQPAFFSPPPIGQVSNRQAMWLPADIPPGGYILQLIIYDGNNGQAFGNPITIPNVIVSAATITPPLTALNIPNVTLQRVGDVELVGYVLPETIPPGQGMWVWLYWRLAAPSISNIPLELQLGSEENLPAYQAPLSDSLGDVNTWQLGQVRRAVYHLPTSPRLTGEAAPLVIRLNTSELSVGSITLQNRPRQFTPPDIQYPLITELGQPARVKLLGYDISNSASRELKLTLYWQGLTTMQSDYTVFVQLLNSAHQVVAQSDAPPLAGSAPTTTWWPDEIVTDSYTLNLPPLPHDQYRLIVGMYQASSGVRLPVSSGGDFVTLGQFVDTPEGLKHN